ncbi:hypothetical protein NS506_04182 [Nocardia seriolae]|uniref:Uncharacterized protein n=1 Tax=Nocardia seriolae TaxID=37332 RepID=A0ABC9YRL0_9NOCA|nr:hypothetical protein NS506_04182 [Nocardia seriolae]GAM45932.1 hypothetical protein NS07_v2contig00021-0039 [Nocardia seriolae]GAP27966.1 hypothetical protein NSK11_contig00025-0048 [Nocardia seriolae]
MAVCAPMSSRRRSTRSASTPEGIDSSITGSVVAVCTSDTSVAALGCSTRIHCAPTVCIQVPRFDTSCAIHSARNTVFASGAHGDTTAGAGLSE